MENLKRWCKNCEDYTLVERNHKRDGNRFFGCINFPSCRVTEKVFEGVGTPDPSQEESDEDLQAEQRKLAQAKIEGAKQLEALALKHGVSGPRAIELQMRAEIPGFGKKYDDLTDEEKELRIKFFNKAVGAMDGMQVLPYDKTEREPGLRRRGRESPDEVE